MKKFIALIACIFSSTLIFSAHETGALVPYSGHTTGRGPNFLDEVSSLSNEPGFPPAPSQLYIPCQNRASGSRSFLLHHRHDYQDTTQPAQPLPKKYKEAPRRRRSVFSAAPRPTLPADSQEATDKLLAIFAQWPPIMYPETELKKETPSVISLLEQGALPPKSLLYTAVTSDNKRLVVSLLGHRFLPYPKNSNQLLNNDQLLYDTLSVPVAKALLDAGAAFPEPTANRMLLSENAIFVSRPPSLIAFWYNQENKRGKIKKNTTILHFLCSAMNARKKCSNRTFLTLLATTALPRPKLLSLPNWRGETPCVALKDPELIQTTQNLELEITKVHTYLHSIQAAVLHHLPVKSVAATVMSNFGLDHPLTLRRCKKLIENDNNFPLLNSLDPDFSDELAEEPE